MHSIQKILLKRLLTQNGQRYAQLTTGYNFEDNVVFHLKQLVGKGFITKNDQSYYLTAEGIKNVTQYDLATIEDTGFKTFFIGFLCKYDNQYLIKEHPAGSNNFYNLPSGKPQFGEPIEKALVRTFKENAGIILNPSDFEYMSLHLKTVKTTEGEVLFDDAFGIYEVALDNSQKSAMKLPEQISWKKIEEIKSLSNRWPELDFCMLEDKKVPYLAYEFVSDYILNS